MSGTATIDRGSEDGATRAVLGGLWIILVTLLTAVPGYAAEVSAIESDNALMLFPTTAHQSEDGSQWVIPLHAWVYEPQSSRSRRGAFAAFLKLRYGLEVTPQSAPEFDARVNLLLADNERGQTIVVDVEGTRAVLPPTSPDGHARAEIRIPVSAATPEGARILVRAVLPHSAPHPVETHVHLIGQTGLSIISDIDDTVKVTHVLDRRRMWESTFMKPFEAVRGIPEAFRRLTSSGQPIHYVSSSPWHLAEPLIAFLGANGLPLSAISLKHFRLKDRTALNIVTPGRKTKPPEIEAILKRYPRRQFILVGDSGEDDPEVYAEALRVHPVQIVRIYIRNVTGATRQSARFATAFAGLDPARWVLFDDPAVIEAP